MNHLRVLRPAAGVYAFYDGRIPGYRFAAEDTGSTRAHSALGIASYAIADGADALVYDTHVSVEHGRLVRETLEAEGIRRLTVVLSHWHLDHVAGTEAFADCEVIACERTAEPSRRTGARSRRGLERAPGDRSAGDADADVRRADRASGRLDAGRVDPARHPQRRRGRRLAAGPAVCCSPATPSRTPSPMSTSRARCRAISRTSPASARWRPGRSSPTTAIPPSSRPGATGPA